MRFGGKFGISLQRTESATVWTKICLEKNKLLWISMSSKSCGLIYWMQFTYKIMHVLCKIAGCDSEY